MNGRWRIEPGSDLDRALNVLVCEQTGEPAPPGSPDPAAATALVEAARCDWVLASLGVRARLAGLAPAPVDLDAQTTEAVWFGGRQEL